MKLKSKKIIQIFLSIMLFGTLYNIKAMSLNNMNFENLPYDMIGEILSYIANPKSIADVTQANIDKIKALRKDESNENKLSGIVKFLEALKKSTCDYLGKFKYKPTLLVEEAVKLNTEFSKECLKELINSESKKYSSEIANKANEIFLFNVERGRIETIKFLIEAGVDPNIKNENGNIALIMAIKLIKKKIVEFLLEAGADPNIKNENGNIALTLAANWGLSEIVELLLEKGADPNIKNEDGDTALMLVASAGKKEMVELLLEKGADPDIKNKDGESASKIAIKRGHKDIANLIKNYGKSTLSSALNKGYEYVSGFIKKYSE